MLKRDTLILIIAAVSGLLSFMLIANYLKSSSADKMQFITAGRPIPKGNIVSKEDVVPSKPMQHPAPDTLYLHQEDIVGNMANEDIAPGSLILRRQISLPPPPPPAAEVKKVSLPIPDGMSALTLAARQVEGIPNTLTEGNFVDILGTVANPEGATAIKPLVRGAKILFVETEDGEVKSISVAVTSFGAIEVSKALTQGKLSLILRGKGGDMGTANVELEAIEIIRGVTKEKSARVKGQG